MAQAPVPAAQYLRVSTREQHESLEHQSAAIAHYAQANGFMVTHTYSDNGYSGLTLKERRGLTQLLADVTAARFTFRAILVYDVSRWGRFQDMDEAAHYEYLCKSSGVPVHYCAEAFLSNGSMPDSIMKALKRTIAGEYSRELSVKVRAGIGRVASKGFNPGLAPNYALRRQLVSPEGVPKRILADGERKSLLTERVIITRGPMEECEVVQRIFREFVHEGLMLKQIADRLNKEGVPFRSGRCWTGRLIGKVLRDTRYFGTQIWGRYSCPLRSRVPQKAPPEDWVVSKLSFEPIIAKDLFELAQEKFQNFTIRLTEEQMLEKLDQLFREHGRISAKLISQGSVPCVNAYKRRFGSLANAYLRLGLELPRGSNPRLLERNKGRRLSRETIAQEILERFPDKLEKFKPNGRVRLQFKVRGTRRLVSFVTASPYTPRKNKERWRIHLYRVNRRRSILLALLNTANANTRGYFYFIPRLGRGRREVQIIDEELLLERGLRIRTSRDLTGALARPLAGRGLLE